MQLPFDFGQLNIAVDSVLHPYLGPKMPESAAGWVLLTIREMVKRNGNCIAIRDGRFTTTYSELDALVKHFERAIVVSERPAGSVIGIAAPRSARYIAAFLAVLARRCVYLPINPAWSAQEVDNILREANCGLGFYSGAERPGSGSVENSTFLSFDEIFRASFETVEVASLDMSSGYDFPLSSPAYIVYTSGSSGKPKGAINSYRGLNNHIQAKVQDLTLVADDRIAQSAPCTFDIHIWQILAPLVVGAECIIYSDSDIKDTGLLADLVISNGVTILELVPSQLYPLLVQLDELQVLQLKVRLLVLSGESLRPSLCTLWWSLVPSVPILNAYGPTECADDVAHYLFRRQAFDGYDAHSVPIGAPLNNTALYLLANSVDGWQQCAAGEVGELFVAGSGVGMGYVAQDAQTRAAFLEDKSNRIAGLVYKTGDMAVADANGVITCLGRIDRQVKLNGQRVELEDLEARIESLHGVLRCSVVVMEEQRDRIPLVTREKIALNYVRLPPSKQVIAFVIPEVRANIDDVFDRIRGVLPSALVPDELLAVENIPVTPSGKVDYRALLELAIGRDVECPSWIRAEPVTAELADIWQRLTGKYPRSLKQTLYESGIDSLQTMVLGAHIGRMAGIRFSPEKIRAARNFGGLVELARSTSPAAVLCVRAMIDPETPFNTLQSRSTQISLQQEGVWFQSQLEPDSAYYNYQGYIGIERVTDWNQIQHAWRRVITRNRHLSGQLEATDDGVRLRYPAFPLHKLGVTDLRGFSEPFTEFRERALSIAQQPLDLDNGPFVMAEAYILSDNSGAILLTMNELALDGWAAEVFTNDFSEQYRLVLRGEEGAVGDPATEYEDYVLEQRRLFDSGDFERARQYWADSLGDSVAELHLPSAKTAAPETYSADLLQVIIPRELTDRVRKFSCTHNVTEFSVLFAALYLVLCTKFEEPGIVIGVPATHRETLDAQRITAFLVNMLPLKIGSESFVSFLDVAKRSGRVLADGFENAAIPYSSILDDAYRRGSLGSQRTLFDVMFNMLNFPSVDRNSGDFSCFDFHELWTGFTKYPLAFYAQPQGDVIQFEVAFMSSRFTKSTMLEIVHEFLGILESGVLDPSATLPALMREVEDHATQ